MKCREENVTETGQRTLKRMPDALLFIPRGRAPHQLRAYATLATVRRAKFIGPE